MSRKYKFADNTKMYFVSFAAINWIDLFIRNEYKDVLLNSIRFCQATKELELYAWCIMTSHVHLIIGTKGNPLQNIIRDLKRHTSEELHKSIQKNNRESRKEWMLWMMERSAKKNNIKSGFQLWQPESHPIELSDTKTAHQKLDYIHNNPVEAGFVLTPESWLYSSAIDYYGGKGLLDIEKLGLLVL